MGESTPDTDKVGVEWSGVSPGWEEEEGHSRSRQPPALFRPLVSGAAEAAKEAVDLFMEGLRRCLCR